MTGNSFAAATRPRTTPRPSGERHHEQQQHEQKRDEPVVGVGEQPEQRAPDTPPTPRRASGRDAFPASPGRRRMPSATRATVVATIEEDRRGVRRGHVVPDAVPRPQRLERDVGEVGDRPVGVAVRCGRRVERRSVGDRVRADDRRHADVDHTAVRRCRARRAPRPARARRSPRPGSGQPAAPLIDAGGSSQADPQHSREHAGAAADTP